MNRNAVEMATKRVDHFMVYTIKSSQRMTYTSRSNRLHLPETHGRPCGLLRDHSCRSKAKRTGAWASRVGCGSAGVGLYGLRPALHSRPTARQLICSGALACS
jgi:hypothetical protein